MKGESGDRLELELHGRAENSGKDRLQRLPIPRLAWDHPSPRGGNPRFVARVNEEREAPVSSRVFACRALAALALVASSFAQGYDIEPAIKTGQTFELSPGGPTAAITGLEPQVSINAAGNVVVVALTASGEALIGRAPTAPPQLVGFGPGPTRFFDFPQINDSSQVVAVDRVGLNRLLRRWSFSGGSLGTFACTTGLTCTNNGFDAVLLPFQADDSDVSFIGLVGADTNLYLDSGFGPVEILTVTGGGLRPMIGDTGKVVIRTGTAATSSEIVYRDGFFPTVIASTADGWNELGAAPGVSDDGQLVAFYGDLTLTKAAEFNLQLIDIENSADPIVFDDVLPGPGIFVSIPTIHGRVVQKIAGTLGPLGFDSFSAFDRVGISRLAGERPFVHVVYSGTKAGTFGVHSSRLNFVTLGGPVVLDEADGLSSVVITDPMPVIEVGDTVSGLGALTSSALYDPVNARGEIALWASFGSGTQAVLVAKPWFDSPFVDRVERNPAQPERANNPGGATLNQVLVHATADDEEASINAFVTGRYGSHYVVGRQGRITQLVQESRRAKHANDTVTSSDLDKHKTNDWSIGIELVDDCAPAGTECAPGTGHRDQTSGWATEKLMKAASELTRDICSRKSIPKQHAIPRPFELFPATNGDRVDTTPFALPVLVPRAFEFYGNYQEGTDPSSSTNSRVRDGFRFDVLGLIDHGQVWNRTSGKEDPRVFDWPSFMARIHLGSSFVLHSPATMLVTDPLGRSTGFDPGSASIVNEIPGSTYSGPGTEPQSLAIPFTLPGDYAVAVTGTATGAFQLDVLSTDWAGGARSTGVRGTTTAGETSDFVLLNAPTDASASLLVSDSNLPPFGAADSALAFPGEPIVIDVLANDSDPDGSLVPSTLRIVVPPAHGLAAVDPGGVISYTSDPSFLGEDQLVYAVDDTQGAPSGDVPVTIHVARPGEPNDRLADATSITQTLGGGAFAGELTIGDNPALVPELDVDLFSVNVAAGGVVAIDVDTEGVDTILRVFDATGTQLGFSDNDAGPSEVTELDPYLEFEAPTRGAYFLGISGAGNTTYDPTQPGSGQSGETGTYGLTIERLDGGALSHSLRAFTAEGTVRSARGTTRLLVSGEVVLSEETDGIDPSREGVVLEVGELRLVFAPGAFSPIGDGRSFAGRVESVVLELRYLAERHYLLTVSGRATSTFGGSGPAAARLVLGNDFGTSAPTIRTMGSRSSKAR